MKCNSAVHAEQLLNAPPTLFTWADVQHAGAQAISNGDTEACVGRVHGVIGKNIAGGTEAIRGDPLHRHVLLVHSVQGPCKQSQMLVGLCRHE